MNEARPYASLSSGLLARKGSAKPAMRPQGFGGLEDLGWNDMGYAAGGAPQTASAPEHVPSSIAALTPAPKMTRTVPGHAPDFHEIDEAEACESEEAFEAAEDDHEGADEAFEAAEETFEPADEGADFAPSQAIEDEGVEPDEPCEVEAAAEINAEPIFEEIEAVETPPVISQQRAILERFDADAEHELSPAPVPASRAARAEIVPLPKRPLSVGGRKAAFTLRLDGDRHLRLRLACAVTGRSAQQIVAHALDEALAGIPEIEALAAQVPAKPGRARAAKRN